MANAQKFDLIIIGAGPAGYVGAIRAAQLGMKVALVESRKTFGGTCVNVGCIPSKALLDSSEHFHFMKSKASKHGIMLGDVKIDLAQMQKRKEGVVRQLTQGVAGLLKKNGVTPFIGTGRFVGIQGELKQVEVTGSDGTVVQLEAPKAMIATGSEPSQLPFMPFDGKNIVSSTEALEFSEVPKHLIVVGGGVIGLELGSVWMRLGSKVTVIEFLNRLCPAFDTQISEELRKSLVKQGMEFKLSHKCLGAKVKDGNVTVEVEDIASGTKLNIEGDKVLVSVGRRAYTQGLQLDKVGLTVDKLGRVDINDHFETSVKGIYAIGDVVRGAMLAHKGEEEGVAAAECMAGQHGHVNYNAIPNVVYTWPEVASVGLTEDELKQKGLTLKIGTFPFIANGRAKAMDEIEGLVKIISDAKTDRVYGVHIFGPRASEMIAEATAVIEFGGSSEDIARTCHAHPTLAEVMKEAAMAVDKRQIHM